MGPASHSLEEDPPPVDEFSLLDRRKGEGHGRRVIPGPHMYLAWDVRLTWRSLESCRVSGRLDMPLKGEE